MSELTTTDGLVTADEYKRIRFHAPEMLETLKHHEAETKRLRAEADALRARIEQRPCMACGFDGMEYRVVDEPIASAETLEQLAEIAKAEAGKAAKLDATGHWIRIVTAVLQAAKPYVDIAANDKMPMRCFDSHEEWLVWLNSHIRYRVQLPEEQPTYRAHMQHASETVSKWPEWKQNVLAHTQPTEPAPPEDEEGIYPKYEVSRTDGRDLPGEKHHDCDLFVLDLTHDQAAIPAMLAYAEACAVTRPTLSRELSEKYGQPSPAEPTSTISDEDLARELWKAYQESTDAIESWIELNNETQQGMIAEAQRAKQLIPAYRVPEDE